MVTLPLGFVTIVWLVGCARGDVGVLHFGQLELIAEEIEDPFGVDENDLPLDDMCATIRANTDEILSRG